MQWTSCRDSEFLSVTAEEILIVFFGQCEWVHFQLYQVGDLAPGQNCTCDFSSQTIGSHSGFAGRPHGGSCPSYRRFDVGCSWQSLKGAAVKDWATQLPPDHAFMHSWPRHLHLEGGRGFSLNTVQVPLSWPPYQLILQTLLSPLTQDSRVVSLLQLGHFLSPVLQAHKAAEAICLGLLQQRRTPFPLSVWHSWPMPDTVPWGSMEHCPCTFPTWSFDRTITGSESRLSPYFSLAHCLNWPSWHLAAQLSNHSKTHFNLLLKYK